MLADKADFWAWGRAALAAVTADVKNCTLPQQTPTAELPYTFNIRYVHIASVTNTFNVIFSSLRLQNWVCESSQ